MGKAVIGIKNPKRMARATEAIHQLAGDTEIEFRHDLPQQEKISHALQTLLKIDVQEGSSLSTYRIALNLIALAWNTSLQASEKQAQILREIVEKLTGRLHAASISRRPGTIAH